MGREGVGVGGRGRRHLGERQGHGRLGGAVWIVLVLQGMVVVAVVVRARGRQKAWKNVMF